MKKSKSWVIAVLVIVGASMFQALLIAGVACMIIVGVVSALTGQC